MDNSIISCSIGDINSNAFDFEHFMTKIYHKALVDVQFECDLLVQNYNYELNRIFSNKITSSCVVLLSKMLHLVNKIHNSMIGLNYPS